MNLVFDHVVPGPLENQFEADSVWAGVTEFEAGKSYLVNAPSGKGKSTLIAYAYGLRNDYSGQVLIGAKASKTFGTDEWSALRRESLSILFQDLRLFPQLTAAENIEIKRKLNPVISQDEIKSLTEELEVAPHMHRPAQFLSMGQQQRVAFIRSISQPFKWLLMDEPFSHLDAVNSGRLAEIAGRYCQRYGAGMILTNLGGRLSFEFDKEVRV